MSYVMLLIGFALLMLPGLAGIILPVPGLAYMFVVALVFSFIDKFQHLTVWNLVTLGVILVISIISDMVSGILGAKYGGASKRSLLIGSIGLIIGLSLLPPFGGLIGLFLGVFLSEIASNASKKEAIRAASGSILGSIAGMLLSLLLSILFIVAFIVMGAK